jgi:WXG100 family type VII secretion target
MAIEVNYAQMEAAQGTITRISREIDGKLDTLRAMLQRMEWEGSDRAAYQQHQAKWDQAVTDINNILNEIGTALGSVRQNYIDTEMQNAKAWG